MANPHMARVDTHRVLLVDEAVADEGGRLIDMNENQGRGPVHKYTGPRNRPSKAAKFIYRLVFAALGVALAVHFGLRLVAQVGGGL